MYAHVHGWLPLRAFMQYWIEYKYIPTQIEIFKMTTEMFVLYIRLLKVQ